MPFTVTIHRFQPKTGKHRNQSFELAGAIVDTDDANLPPTFAMAFGDADKNVASYDVVARNHAVTRIVVDPVNGFVHIFTAPTTIRPYNEKVARDLGKWTDPLYAPLDRKPEEPLFPQDDDELISDVIASCEECGHPQDTDEHAGISHLPTTKSHPFSPKGGTNSETNSTLKDELINSGKVREARAWAYDVIGLDD